MEVITASRSDLQQILWPYHTARHLKKEPILFTSIAHERYSDSEYKEVKHNMRILSYGILANNDGHVNLPLYPSD